MEVFYDMIQALLLCMHYDMKDFMNQGMLLNKLSISFYEYWGFGLKYLLYERMTWLDTSYWSNSYYEKTHDLDAFN